MPPVRSRADELVAGLRQRLISRIAVELGQRDDDVSLRLGPAIEQVLCAQAIEWERRLERAERLSSVGQLSASVAHELRNPLSVIETSAFIIAERGKNDERIMRHTRRIAEQVALASSVVGDLLGAARGRALVLAPIDLTALLRSTVAQFSCPDGVALEVELPTDVPSIRADERRLRQVMVNLIANAIEAVAPRGTVQIAARVRADTAHITVTDDGPGISPEHMARLFEPLFTTKPEGTGLGLALSRDIARAHGGDLVARSGREKGAQFELTLPLAARESDGRP